MKYLMFAKSEILVLISLYLCIFIVTGCGKASQLPGLVPAKGDIKYKNAPVEGAALTFFPETVASNTDHSSEQRPATAVSDASGRFTMMTLQPDDGVFPGQYTVVITKNIPERIYTNEEMQEFFRQGRPTPIPQSTNELPEQYSSPTTSPLKIDLGPKGDKTLKFELVD
ncbi:MAG: carboxypeptidase-like regulatory domain-containing protein [Planctomycetaceae bacterium]|nr:carboxypeptidase-like regulatory domain-containing protein [Planctomycetaceae bacterium]